MNSKCPDFEGRYKCQYFIVNGACSRQDRFMCHVFIDTEKPPVEDDVPLFLKETLETFAGSTVEMVIDNKWAFTKEAKAFLKAEAAAKNKKMQQVIVGVEQKGKSPKWSLQKHLEARQKRLEDIFGKPNF